MQGTLKDLTAKVLSHVRECDEISEATLWDHHDGTLVWRAKRFTGTPHFYTVYRWRDYYSYSLLALILLKVEQGGVLELNPAAIDEAKAPGFMVYAGERSLDLDIWQIGGPHRCGYEITKVDDYASRIATALCEDTAALEGKNPGTTNVVLCGGKDSLNLLLLPWKQPLKALSASPNYPLVREFVARNKLPIEVLELGDPFDDQHLRREVLECCARTDLVHWRWGADLVRVARQHDGNVVFWKGQLADLYTTNKWKAFHHPPNLFEEYARKVYKRLPAPFLVRREVGRLLQPRVVQATWSRCAHLQGCHMAFIRALADALVLSAYHGPRMLAVWSSADLGSVAQKDMRHLIGRRLLGREVWYPSENPAPPPSTIRSGLSHPARFLDLVRSEGLPLSGGA
ncbi:MAG: hypothetical protein IT383_07925 [Deltaproteobacteria bacterium]|nr:hypothetical protein [Deltaproteobacteria bacterium]